MICLKRLYSDFIPCVIGQLSTETIYILDKLNLEFPVTLSEFPTSVNKVVVVDTHHRAQLGNSFPYNNVIKIIDHHPAGDDKLFINAIVDNRKIGAAASIVGEMLYESGLLEEKLARLLQYAIASNTLNFTAPSTADYDKEIFKKLHLLSPVTEVEIEESFKHRSYTSVLSDMKYFDYLGGRIAIAQIEQYGTFADKMKSQNELNECALNNNLLFAILNCVDIKNKKSMICFSSGISDYEASNIFGLDVHNGICIVDRILLRKTDFIPNLNR